MKKIILLGSILLFSPIYGDIFKYTELGDLAKVKTCVQKGADVNLQNDDDRTALMVASDQGYLEIVKYLVANGANINEKGLLNWTSLLWASYKGHTEVVKYLVANGADVNLQNNDGDTALMLAHSSCIFLDGSVLSRNI